MHLSQEKVVMDAATTRQRVSLGMLSGLFILSGLLHFLFPEPYVSIVPPWLPFPRSLVFISGVAEVAGGVGLLIQRVRHLAGWGLIVLLLAVWPANLQMLLDARQGGVSAASELLLLLRLLLQVVLIVWVWRVSRLGAKRMAWAP
jgi:uncharacterized membrane protein